MTDIYFRLDTYAHVLDVLLKCLNLSNSETQITIVVVNLGINWLQKKKTRKSLHFTLHFAENAMKTYAPLQGHFLLNLSKGLVLSKLLRSTFFKSSEPHEQGHLQGNNLLMSTIQFYIAIISSWGLMVFDKILYFTDDFRWGASFHTTR